MRLQPRTWFLISLLLFALGAAFWLLGDRRRAATPAPSQPAPQAAPPDLTLKSTAASEGQGARDAEPAQRGPTPQPASGPAGTPPSTRDTRPSSDDAEEIGRVRYPHRLSNTSKSLDELTRSDTAILLRNALIDTADPTPLAVPEHLRAKGDPGSYIVQSRGPIDAAFRELLRENQATIVSYIPNNAYLVRASGERARTLKSHGRVQAVLAYEPYHKLEPSLLALAVSQQPLPPGSWLNLTLFPGERAAAEAALRALGATIQAEQPSPFGPLLTVEAPADSLVSLANLPSVQGIEPHHRRTLLNDLTRVRLGVAPDTLATTTNYLGLTGTNVLVNVNDTGVDRTHPDLTPRVIGPAVVDRVGHGTHVAGIIASSGRNSPAGTNVQGSLPDADFRGLAPGARIFSQEVSLTSGPLVSDTALLRAAALTNAFISNNSWNYPGAAEYDSAAATYDAATRDALEERPGSQPLLFVFGAGNDGFGRTDGLGGEPGRITSPATAKNVLTVGAIEAPRRITNLVTIEVEGGDPLTNAIWLEQTDSDNQVASFSSRGNVGLGQEGSHGRFKPDVVAPGTFVVSTRPRVLNTTPPTTRTQTQRFDDQRVQSGFSYDGFVFVPDNAVSFSIEVLPNIRSPQPFPQLPIFLKAGGDFPTPDDLAGSNRVTVPPDAPFTVGPWRFTIGNETGQTVEFDLLITITIAVRPTDSVVVFEELNDPLEPLYRYASGTSQAAAAVSGTLALMQEFFRDRLERTPSPALLKALLINGARSVGEIYDLNPRSTINHQGWGLIHLPNSLPAGLTNADETLWPVRFFDQEVADAVATGQTRSWELTLTNSLALLSPLRVTLVWTDPPGNPNAALKLVNDLDLVVSNAVTHQVFYGNDFESGADFVRGRDTNEPPVFDNVNNVENVFIREPLGSNYVISVIGRRVNVNAVTADTNNVVQDYALVISAAGDGTLADLKPVTPSFELRSFIALTNGIALPRQQVGANPSMRADAIGLPNQWNFYVFTNVFLEQLNPAMTNGSNVAFVTFLAPDLSRPRNLDADVDLYVSRDPGLLSLNPAAVTNAFKSTQRGGTELVVFTNAVVGPDEVFYIGVKSEDQQGAEYTLIALSSNQPFQTTDDQGILLRAPQIMVPIPDGSPQQPGGANVIAIGLTPVPISRIVVTNAVVHDNIGDLLGNLTHNNKFVVLNNHRVEADFNPSGPEFIRYIWDESGQGGLFSDGAFVNIGPIPTDGPGSLNTFLNEESAGVWLLTMIDNSLTHTGRVENLFIRIVPDLTSGNLLAQGREGVQGRAEPGQFAYFPIIVPAGATELHVFLSDLDPALPLELYLREGQTPDRTFFDKFAVIGPPGGELAITTRDVPPLNAGQYFAGVYNPNGVAVTFRIAAEVVRGSVSEGFLEFYSQDTPRTLLDDALTTSQIEVGIGRPVADLRVGVRLEHPLASDTVLHLVSPEGSRVLLAENRGLNAAARYGGGELPDVSYTVFTDDTNLAQVPIKFASVPFTPDPPAAPLVLSGFETVSPGTYPSGATVEGWIVESGSASVRSDARLAHSGTNYLALEGARIARVVPTTVGKEYRLRFAARSGDIRLYNTGIADDGSPLAEGAVDPHYRLVQSPDPNFTGPQTYVAAGADFPPRWPANNIFSQWIAPRPDITNAVSPGLYVYRTTFNLAGFDLFTAEVTGRVAPDSRLNDLVFNGNSTGIRAVGTGFSREFTLRGGFSPGTNTLDFVVENFSQSSGFRAELDLRGRPLNPPELRIGGVFTNALSLTTAWETNEVKFVAASTDTRLAFVSPGAELRLDAIEIRELGDTWYLPEEDLRRQIVGETARGAWNLEVWDNRTGPASAQLLSWRLQLRLANTNVAAVRLTNEVCRTGTLAANEVKYFYVEVPAAAFVANNILTGSGDLVLRYGPTGAPTGVSRDELEINERGPGEGETLVLTPNGFPPLRLGQRYYLGVATADGSPSDFTICMNFGVPDTIVTLENGVPFTNSIPVTNRLDYYQFDVSPNAFQVTFDLAPQDGNVDLFVRKARPVPQPLPTPLAFDYASTNGGTAADQVLVTPRSPIPLEPGLWLLGVQNADVVPVNYTITATELTNVVRIIDLTPGVPLDFTMPAGRPITNYFRLTVTQNNPLAQFDLYNLTGAGDLLVQLEALPAPDSALVTDRGTPRSPVRVQLRPTSFLSTLNGQWLLTVANQETNDLDFTLLATFPPDAREVITLTNGIAYTNTVPVSLPRGTVTDIDFYRFEVSADATDVDFELLPVDGNVDLLIRQDLLPDDVAADYRSENPGTTNELVSITGSSFPIALAPGSWFIGVINRDAQSVSYSIRATEHLPNVIELLNGQPYLNAVEDPALLDYYSFNVTPNATNVVFEIVNAEGPVELFARFGLPLPNPANADYRASGVAPVISVQPNSAPVPLQPGVWYLSISNQTPARVEYTIQATQFPAPAPPPGTDIDSTITVTATNICLTWQSVPGTAYFVQGRTNLTDTTWTVIERVVASGTSTTYCLDLPTPFSFFRVTAEEAPPPPAGEEVEITGTFIQDGSLCLVWDSEAGVSYFIQGRASLTDTNWVQVAGPIVATGASTTNCVALPTPFSFFRVVRAGAAGLPTVTVTATDATATEGASDFAVFTVTRTEPSSAPLVVNFEWSGAAVEGRDFGPVGTSVTIPAGDLSVEIVVQALTDSETEAPETLTLTLVADAAYTLGTPADATITILDAPAPEPVKIDETSFTATQVCYTFATEVGATYFLQGRPSQADTLWIEVAGTRVTATETNTTVCVDFPPPFPVIRAVREATASPPPPPTGAEANARIVVTSTNICLTWESVAGTTYQIQGRTNLTDTAWEPVATVVAVGTNTTHCIDLPTPYGYFRVVAQGGGPPPPVTPPRINPALSFTATDVCLTWDSVPGAVYAIEVKSDLGAAAWTEVRANVASQGDQTTACVPLGGSAQFFRVVVPAGAGGGG